MVHPEILGLKVVPSVFALLVAEFFTYSAAQSFAAHKASACFLFFFFHIP